MRFTCFVRDDPQSRKCYELLYSYLTYSGWVKDDAKPQMVITIGGDGTVLAAIHQYIDILNNVAFIGINTGSLGFYSNYRIEEFNQFVNDLLSGKPQFEYKRMIEAIVDNDIQQPIHALNEVRIESNIKAAVIQVAIDNHPFELISGNGLCISTQAGSTAYNRSLGGAIIDEKLGQNVGLQISEILPVHNSSYRSLKSSFVLAPQREVTIYDRSLIGDFGMSMLCYDNQYESLKGKKQIHVKMSNVVVYFAYYRSTNYIERIKTLF